MLESITLISKIRTKVRSNALKQKLIAYVPLESITNIQVSIEVHMLITKCQQIR